MDSTAAIPCARSDDAGTGQRFAIATVGLCSRLLNPDATVGPQPRGHWVGLGCRRMGRGDGGERGSLHGQRLPLRDQLRPCDQYCYRSSARGVKKPQILEMSTLYEWKHPKAPRVALLFDANKATKAALTFLRNTKVGQMDTIPLGGMKGMWERRQESEERERRKPGAFRVGGSY